MKNYILILFSLLMTAIPSFTEKHQEMSKNAKCDMEHLIAQKSIMVKNIMQAEGVSEEKAQNIIDKFMEMRKKGMERFNKEVGVNPDASHKEAMIKLMGDAGIEKETAEQLCNRILEIMCNIIDSMSETEANE